MAESALITIGVAGAGLIVIESVFGLLVPSLLVAVSEKVTGVPVVAAEGTPEIVATPPSTAKVSPPADTGVAA